jgi:alkylhydroperoxidase/carboxymuconolactone decarboxylase family protein YurZ
MDTFFDEFLTRTTNMLEKIDDVISALENMKIQGTDMKKAVMKAQTFASQTFEYLKNLRGEVGAFGRDVRYWEEAVRDAERFNKVLTEAVYLVSDVHKVANEAKLTESLRHLISLAIPYAIRCLKWTRSACLVMMNQIAIPSAHTWMNIRDEG